MKLLIKIKYLTCSHRESYFYLTLISAEFTSFFSFTLGSPQGSSPPGKLGILRQIIDLILQSKKNVVRMILKYKVHKPYLQAEIYVPLLYVH